jgi:thioredoxin-related protein
MYPHERSLVKKLEGRPFVIIGVNSDDDRDVLKERMTAEQITWRSFWDGGSTDGPIATKWNVRGWPTVYLIDHEGKIIGRHGYREEDDPIIEKAVAAAEDAAKSK